MSFEAFEVYLTPAATAPLRSGDTPGGLDEIVCVIQAQWPEFRSDDVEAARRYGPLSPDARLLVRETPSGLIQLSAQRIREDDSVALSLRFAYCNPPTVSQIFCDMVEWLMRRFQLRCHIAADLAPEQEGESDDFDSAEQVRSLLIPSISYNRRLWQHDVGTREEAVLRPGEALAHYVAPLLVN